MSLYKVSKSLLDSITNVIKDGRTQYSEEQAEMDKKAAAKLINEAKTHTVPKTDKEKKLAALAEPKDKITHADVMVGRGVGKMKESMDAPEKPFKYNKKTGTFDRAKKMEEMSSKEKMKKGLYNKEEVDPIDETLGATLRKYVPGFARHQLDRKAADSSEKASAARGRMGDTHKTIVNDPDRKEWEKHAKNTARYEKLHSKAKGIKSSGLDGEQYALAMSSRKKAPDYQKEEVELDEVLISKETKKDFKARQERLAAASAQTEKDPARLARLSRIPGYTAAMDLAKKTTQKEETDTPGNGREHQCAIHVKSEQFGEGKTLFSQHAEPDADGNIGWYDVMFEHGIEKQVPTSDLEILVSESHMSHKKKKGM